MKFPFLVLALLLSMGVKAQYSYAHLHDNLDGSYVILPDYALRFSFDEHYNTTEDLNYSIYTDGYVPITTSSTILPVQRGNNRYSILDVNCEFGLSLEAFYILEVIDSKGKKKFLRFYLPSGEAPCE